MSLPELCEFTLETYLHLYYNANSHISVWRD